MKKEVFRIGDKVKIVNAEEFVRCGYPMAFDDVMYEIKKRHYKKIHKIAEDVMETIKSPKLEEWKDLSYFSSRNPFSKNLKEKIAEIFASAYMNYHEFGGNKRLIYTKPNESILGQTCYIANKKTVITGERYGCYNSCGHTPWLEKRKSHVILKVMPEQYGRSFWIEAKNVEKVWK